MILKVMNSNMVDRSIDRKKFIPFINQRDHMGNIVNQKQRSFPCTFKPEQILQNLKKNMKEHSFDRQMEKMNKKLEYFKKQLEPKEDDWGKKVDECIKIVQQMQNRKKTEQNCEKYYVNLHEQLSKKINDRRKQVMYTHNNNQKNLINQIKKCPKKYSLYNNKNSLFKYQYKKNKTFINENNYMNFPQKDQKSVFNIKNKENKSTNSLMHNFTKCGQKYKHMVQCSKYDPWNKWYKTQQLELFPGEKIKLKVLTKNLY